MPIISVIVPAYNAEKTIVETISSVLRQSFGDLELIVINDGSTDKTLELINTISDARLQVFSFSNGGLSVARNRGIHLAKGEYLAFLDADDLWTHDKLSAQITALKQYPEAGVSYSWIYSMDEQGESIKPGISFNFQGDVYPDLLVNNFIVNGSNCLITREAIELIGEFDSTVDGAADWDYWLRLAAKFPFVLVPKYQIFYRGSSGTMSAKIEYMEQCMLRVTEKAFQTAPLELQPLKKQSLANTYRYLAYKYWTFAQGEDKIRKTRETLSQAIRLYPLILKDRRVRNIWIKLAIIRIFNSPIGYALINWFQTATLAK